jgi:REP element-mobilizing transposase RayT
MEGQEMDESLGDQSETPAERRSAHRIPHNPGLQRLIDGKQSWSEPLDNEDQERGFLGWHQRGYLPHYDRPGLTQFVTFRLSDAMPATRRSEWETLMHLEDQHQRRTKLEEYLDNGFGECWLGQAPIAALTQEAFLYFAGQRYGLNAWVVMPSHVHVLLEVWQVPLSQILRSWKGFVARKANKTLCRVGAFWERDLWDTYIRDDHHFNKAVRYIEANPAKAHLVRENSAWLWSSARFRDTNGKLQLPPRTSNAAEF